MSKILITGGSGFIGSHLCRKLLELGHDVTVLDLKEPKYNVQYLKYDVSKDNFINEIDSSFDYIYHMAAAISVPESIKNPTKYFNNNITGTFNVLELAKNINVKRVIFSSSASVYGIHAPPHIENLSTSTLNLYAASKAAGENLMQVYNSSYNIDTVSLRYFNVFGPEQDPNSPYAAVIPKFINKILSNEEIDVYGDGEQSRDFIYINDVIGANIACMDIEKTNGEVINVCTGKSITVNELISKLKNISKNNIKVNYLADQIGAVKHSFSSNKKMQDLLKYDRFVDLDNALGETFKWFENEYN
jgi:UDP-glucose 4-epimerase